MRLSVLAVSVVGAVHMCVWLFLSPAPLGDPVVKEEKSDMGWCSAEFGVMWLQEKNSVTLLQLFLSEESSLFHLISEMQAMILECCSAKQC